MIVSLVCKVNRTLTSVVEHSSGPSAGSRYNPNGGPAGIPDISKVKYEGYESDEASESGGQEVVTAVSHRLLVSVAELMIDGDWFRTFHQASNWTSPTLLVVARPICPSLFHTAARYSQQCLIPSIKSVDGNHHRPEQTRRPYYGGSASAGT